MSDPQGQSLATGAKPENSQTTTTDNPQTATTQSAEGLKLEGFDEKDRGKLTRFKTQNDLAKSYLELERRLGASVVLPGKDAKPEEVGAFYQKLGRPESPDGYELDQVYAPNGTDKVDFGEEDFKKAAFEIGLSKEQAKKLHQWSVRQVGVRVEQMKKKQEEAIKNASDALRRLHGLKYDEKLALIPLVNRKFGDDDWTRFLNEGSGNHPAMLKFLIKVGEAMSEETLIQGRPAPATTETREPGVLSYPNRPEITGRQRFRSVR